VLKAVERVFKITEKRGVLVADRGFDSGVIFNDWLDNKYRFVVRLVGKCHLLRLSEPLRKIDSGQWIPIRAGLPAGQLPTLHPFSRVVKRRGKVILRVS
jgi:hypothetical protein